MSAAAEVMLSGDFYSLPDVVQFTIIVLLMMCTFLEVLAVLEVLASFWTFRKHNN